MLSTCAAILAVDFSIFPRRFAKTETFGTSLMDAGVGSFVLSNSLTLAPLLLQTESRDKPRDASRARRAVSLLLPTVPLVLLGLGRLVSVTLSDYQHHEGEYGVHWNFFFTLAAMPAVAAAVVAGGGKKVAMVAAGVALGALVEKNDGVIWELYW